MIYPIQQLQNIIDTHLAAIEKLKRLDNESYGAELFVEEEIKEREGYVAKLKQAISILLNSNNK